LEEKVNKVILVGRLGKDPESKATSSGGQITTFSLATSDGFGDNKTTNWHNVVVFGKAAPSVATYLQKGSQAAVDGRIQYRTWDKKDGTKGYSTEIIADHVEFLSSQEGSRLDKSPEFNQEVAEDDSELPF
jgi:single-strand DNA-binding protein